jgi:hypothetical protein
MTEKENWYILRIIGLGHDLQTTSEAEGNVLSRIVKVFDGSEIATKAGECAKQHCVMIRQWH